MSVGNLLSPANGKPIVVPTQDMVLGIYYLTKKKSNAKGAGKIFADSDEVIFAYQSGIVEKHAPIKVKLNGKLVETTVGRILLSEIVPKDIPFEMINKEFTKKELGKLIEYIHTKYGKRETVLFLNKIEKLGFETATLSGISICIDDMHIPSKKAELIREAEAQVMEVQRQYAEGLITQGERYNKVIDIWANVTELVADEMMKELGAEEGKEFTPEELAERRSFNSIFMMADSGARGSIAQIRQLAGMRGLMAKPSGEIIETPITANFREGLTPLQYFISTHGARKGLADTALKTANAGYLTRRLVDVAQDIILTETDCGTKDGIYITALIEGGEIVMPLEDRIYGRTIAEDIKDPLTGEIIVKRNILIDQPLAKKIVDAGIDRVKIRSVLTCRSKYGVCSKCYGMDLARGEPVEIGEAIGVIAAQSIGEPGTQLTMRTFHIGGAATKIVEQAVLEAKGSGTVKFNNLHYVERKDGSLIVLNRNALIIIVDSSGREREKYNLVYGAKLLVKEGFQVEAGQRLAEWDAYTTPIITEIAGKVALGDLVEGVTFKEETDPTTGLSHKIIIDYPATYRPRVTIKDSEGKTAKLPTGSPARYLLPAGAILVVDKGDKVEAGDILAKIPRETIKTKDITGGLPRVAELFEARRPKEAAIVSEIDGIVELKGVQKGSRVIVVRGVDETREYIIPKGKHVIVHDGDWVKAGEPLIDGSINPHSILDILGPTELQRYLVDEIQKVYRLQGVSIHDKHIEVIVRQMMKKVRIEDPGDTSFLIGDEVERTLFIEENERVVSQGGKPAQGKPLLLGITKAALSTESWVSSASFQETTRVLTDAAIEGKIDDLRGLKENVIMGRIIPAGTGSPLYKDTLIKGEFYKMQIEHSVEEITE
jgi:DNA-directed RNA polymerase subunit beta'